MIIKLTPAEVKEFLNRALGLCGTLFELEISAPESALLGAFRTAIRDFPRHASDQKISAIKRFRELAPRSPEGYYSCVSLADSKWAVENSVAALSNLELTGKIRPL